MEVNVIFDKDASPRRDVGPDDSMVSMKFSTPTQLTISRRLVVNPSLRKSSSKKKRLQYPADEKVSSPDVKEIADPGYVPDLFDLGILCYLHDNGPDIKPVKADLQVDHLVMDESILTSFALVFVESASINSLLVHAHQTTDIESMTASNVVSVLVVDRPCSCSCIKSAFVY
jgi:hypothetical protein